MFVSPSQGEVSSQAKGFRAGGDFFVADDYSALEPTGWFAAERSIASGVAGFEPATASSRRLSRPPDITGEVHC
jgi:hypothetical protein